jgi:hypothetical protein
VKQFLRLEPASEEQMLAQLTEIKRKAVAYMRFVSFQAYLTADKTFFVEVTPGMQADPQELEQAAMWREDLERTFCEH